MRKGVFKTNFETKSISSVSARVYNNNACIYVYIIMTHSRVTFADNKTINYFFWLLLLIIHLCEVEYGL